MANTRTMMSYMVLVIVLQYAVAAYSRNRYETSYSKQSSYEQRRKSYEPIQPEHYGKSYDGQTHLIIDNHTLSRLNELEEALQRIVYKVGKLEGLTSNINKPLTYHSNLDSGTSTQLMYLLMNKLGLKKGREHKEKAPSTNCQKDGYEWVEEFGNCIKIHQEELTWGEARLKCIEEGADLIVLDTEAKQGALVERLVLFGDVWFIGLSDTETEGTFSWVNGELLVNTFELWYAAEPSNSPGDGDCAVLDFEISGSVGAWFDRDCHSDEKFVCESKKKEPKHEKSYSYSYGYMYDGEYDHPM